MANDKQSSRSINARLESRVEALERLFENFVEQWRAERDELRTAIREQGETLLETWRAERKELQDAIQKQGEELSKSWRSDRQALFDELHNQSEEFKTQLRELTRQMEMRRETSRALSVQWVGIGATFLAIAAGLIMFAVRAYVNPLETKMSFVLKHLDQVDSELEGASKAVVSQASRLKNVERKVFGPLVVPDDN